eukprot:TRINITY_DN761_c0_g1_i11.p1 TRINITY_DN761_c0_g1~~TRINITY_DN761_c0_g1_i11.p1  ORF type:complete len:377 (-),score=50.20 TRINITY_DN761_c0_g1_i11:1082-2212(-)
MCIRDRLITFQNSAMMKILIQRSSQKYQLIMDNILIEIDLVIKKNPKINTNPSQLSPVKYYLNQDQLSKSIQSQNLQKMHYQPMQTSPIIQRNKSSNNLPYDMLSATQTKQQSDREALIQTPQLRKSCFNQHNNFNINFADPKYTAEKRKHGISLSPLTIRRTEAEEQNYLNPVLTSRIVTSQNPVYSLNQVPQQQKYILYPADRIGQVYQIQKDQTLIQHLPISSQIQSQNLTQQNPVVYYQQNSTATTPSVLYSDLAKQQLKEQHFTSQFDNQGRSSLNSVVNQQSNPQQNQLLHSNQSNTQFIIPISHQKIQQMTTCTDDIPAKRLQTYQGSDQILKSPSGFLQYLKDELSSIFNKKSIHQKQMEEEISQQYN